LSAGGSLRTAPAENFDKSFLLISRAQELRENSSATLGGVGAENRSFIQFGALYTQIRLFSDAGPHCASYVPKFILNSTALEDGKAKLNGFAPYTLQIFFYI
jgi:hypothetical protein